MSYCISRVLVRTLDLCMYSHDLSCYCTGGGAWPWRSYHATGLHIPCMPGSYSQPGRRDGALRHTPALGCCTSRVPRHYLCLWTDRCGGSSSFCCRLAMQLRSALMQRCTNVANGMKGHCRKAIMYSMMCLPALHQTVAKELQASSRDLDFTVAVACAWPV